MIRTLSGAAVLLGLAAAPGCAERVALYEDSEPGATLQEPMRQRLTAASTGSAESATGGATLASFAEAGSPTAAGPQNEPMRRKIVYTAQFEVLVASTENAVSRFLKYVEAKGGYLGKRQEETVTVRVPAAQFRDTVDELKTYGVITRQSLEALDVTRKYFDLRIRVDNAEKARERLLALLEKAEKVEDAIKIEAELRRLTEEIERLKGELKYLSEQIAFSTITVRFRSNAPQVRVRAARKPSRFEWINEIGVEHVLRAF